MGVAGLVIAIIALLISGFVAWNNFLSPFNVKVSCGNPRLEPLPLKLEDGGEVFRFYAILPLHFTNTGAKGGTISDIALIVKSEENTWLFQPAFYTKYGVQTELTLGKKLTKDPSNEPFYPINLAGKTTIYKSIVFTPAKHEKYPFGANPLLPDIYTFTVQTLKNDEEDYETQLTFNLVLQEEQVTSLSRGNYLIPFTEELKKKRQQI